MGISRNLEPDKHPYELLLQLRRSSTAPRRRAGRSRPAESSIANARSSKSI